MFDPSASHAAIKVLVRVEIHRNRPGPIESRVHDLALANPRELQATPLQTKPRINDSEVRCTSHKDLLNSCSPLGRLPDLLSLVLDLDGADFCL
jgi:hypothetical protein